MWGLDQAATVYGETDPTGAFTTVLRTGLACRLAHVRGGASQNERAELAAVRNMIWDPSYVLPETAQVEVDGVRWNPVAGTFAAYRGPSSQVLYRRCDLVRV